MQWTCDYSNSFIYDISLQMVLQDPLQILQTLLQVKLCIYVTGLSDIPTAQTVHTPWLYKKLHKAYHKYSKSHLRVKHFICYRITRHTYCTDCTTRRGYTRSFTRHTTNTCSPRLFPLPPFTLSRSFTHS